MFPLHWLFRRRSFSRSALARISLFVFVLLCMATTLRAAGNKPTFLTESVSNIPAGLFTYEVWYTTFCLFDPFGECKCETGAADNDCIATVDGDGDGRPESGPDDDGDGVLDVVDPDFTDRWDGSSTMTESVPVNVQAVLDVYLNDWGLRNPLWNEITNRDIYLFDQVTGASGFAYGDGSSIDLDTGFMTPVLC
jgi:hypothetical protein